jgi:branched-chain amino acid transport system permease protein
MRALTSHLGRPAGGESAVAGWAPRVRWLVLGVAALVALALPYGVSSFWVNIATQGLIFGLFALSINLISGYGGMITLGHAGMLGVAGYTVAILTTKDGWSLGSAVVAALVVCTLVSIFFGALAVRTRGTYFVMITLAEGMVIWGIAQRWSELTGGENGIPGIPKPSFATQYWQYYYFVLAVVAVCTVLIARLVRSPFGLTLKGIREADDRLPPLGYHVPLHKLIAFTISGVFAGVAGVLLAMYNNFIGPTDAFFLASAEGLLMSILGGIGTLTGAYVGATVVIVIQEWVSSYFARWQTLLGVVFVLVIVFAPDGLVGAWTRLVWAPLLRRLGAGKAAAAARTAASSAAGATVAAGAGPVAAADGGGGGGRKESREGEEDEAHKLQVP